MLDYTTGNLLDADVEALVNTVNTVGVMGKGIALMFKERFPSNMESYARACRNSELQVGKMFVTETSELMGPRWIINFPTKQHWRAKSQIEWIEEGLKDLRQTILNYGIKSIAIPPLGAGNGGLLWSDVKPQIERVLGDLTETRIVVYEPFAEYQNVVKRTGVQTLTPARALIAELVRRYWVLGIECSLLEIQKLAWFLERAIDEQNLPSLDLQFEANNYGPYADRLRHLLNALDGSYLQSQKRISDCSPLDIIWFNDSKREIVEAFLRTQAKDYLPALDRVSRLIDGFESPYGLELLATVDWLISKEKLDANIDTIRKGISDWPGGEKAAARKNRLFDNSRLELALKRINSVELATHV